MDQLYFPPVAGEYLQGDIFRNMPSVVVDERPLQAARFWKQSGDRPPTYGVHSETGQPPNGGFTWHFERGGEVATLVHGYLELAMLISHDCEIENDPVARTVAMVRPASHLDAKTQEAIFSGRSDDGHYAIFPLDEQTVEPQMERCFVDFRRLTTVRHQVLERTERVASVSEDLRRAVSERFKQYLFRRVGV